MPNATATAITPATAHQGVGARSGVLTGSAPDPRPGIQRRPSATRIAAIGIDTTSMRTGRNTPASSSGNPASSQAITSSAGSTVSRPSNRAAASPVAGPPSATPGTEGPGVFVSAPMLVPPLPTPPLILGTP